MHRRMDNLIPYADEAAGPRLRAIAEQLHRLAPSRTDPHRYFEQKSSMVDELRRLALGLDQVVPRRPKAIGTDRFSVRLMQNGDTAETHKPGLSTTVSKMDAAPAGTAFGGGRSRRGAIGCGCAMSICSNGRAGGATSARAT